MLADRVSIGIVTIDGQILSVPKANLAVRLAHFSSEVVEKERFAVPLNRISNRKNAFGKSAKRKGG